MNEWLVIAGAVAFRFFECAVKVYKATGKVDLKAIVKDFFSVS